MKALRNPKTLFFAAVCGAVLGLALPVTAQDPGIPEQAIYNGALQNSWQNESSANVNFASVTPVWPPQDTASIAVTAGSNQALYLSCPPQDSTPFANLGFWIQGGPVGGQTVHVHGVISGTVQTVAYSVGPLAANLWQYVEIPLAALGLFDNPKLTGFQIVNESGATLPTFCLDDINLIEWTNPAPAQADQPVYTDSLQNGWQNWSWAAVDLSNTTAVHTGAKSISVTAGGYQALYFSHPAESSMPYVSVGLWINGGATGGQILNVQGVISGNGLSESYPIGPLKANTWQFINIPFTWLSAQNNPNFTGFWVANSGSSAEPAFYVDDVHLVAGSSSSGLLPSPPNPAVAVSVDATANVHAISPLIYGVSSGTTAQLAVHVAGYPAGINAPLNRYGGDNATRYNWRLNADNKANDYYYESIGDASSVAGERGDTIMSNSKAAGSQAMITIPMIPWVAKLGANRGKLDSFSVAKYGAQRAVDPYWSDAGNGVRSNGADVTGNDPKDANVPNSPAMQQGWIQHIVSTWGSAASGGLKYYIMDNESGIWHGTHRDVHPIGAHTSEILNDILQYSALVKAADPTAFVVGPEEWGWSGYFYSGYDNQYAAAPGRNGVYPDQAATGGNLYYLQYLLQQIQQHDASAGKRSLDVFTVHYYPQGNEYSNDDSAPTDLLRNRSTRELWDPNYVSQSWIGSTGINNGIPEIIPLMANWIDTYYPGTLLGITEYSWGNDANMNGGTAQADILGIFGRLNGLAMASRWTCPATGTPAYLAMQIYRNYDGNGSTFGDQSVSASAPDPDALSSFAALRGSDGALTVMVVNKMLPGAPVVVAPMTPLTINLNHFTAAPGSSVQVYQVNASSAASGAVAQLPNLTVSGGALSTSLPGQTITMFVIPLDGFAAWRAKYFTSVQLAYPAISGPTADPYGTGIPNLLAYAMQWNPKTARSTKLPRPTPVNGHLREIYVVPNAVNDLTYTVQVSTDLVHWIYGAGYTQTISSVADADGTTITIEDTLPANTPMLFMRLAVSQNP